MVMDKEDPGTTMNLNKGPNKVGHSNQNLRNKTEKNHDFTHLESVRLCFNRLKCKDE